MNIKRATALALSLSLLLGAAACGKTGSEAADTGSKTSAQLLEEENAILGAHQELWDQVFASMDKSSPATAKNYGDVLLSALENCKDKLSDEDYQTLKSDAESIRSIEEQIASLPPTTAPARAKRPRPVRFRSLQARISTGMRSTAACSRTTPTRS